MLQIPKKTQLMGILNCTPDSFFDGGRILETERAIEYGLRLFKEGADILDIGGESTNPDSTPIAENEEIQRVIPVIKGIRASSSRPISVDTFKPKVAEAALNAGANWINDITGFQNPAMRKLARESGSKICVMHLLGDPHTQPLPVYPKGVISEILVFFKKRIDLLLSEGIDAAQIILDPGIGGGAFGKTPDQSLLILKSLKKFQDLGFPILIGLSRKSFLQKILHKKASEILSTTLALNTMTILSGVEFIRVHDVAEHRDILTVLERLAFVNEELVL